MKQISSIIVVGSSGNGKTTLVNGLRQHGDKFIFPKRYITRPKRQGDDLLENQHVSHQKFDQLLKDGQLQIVWNRPLGKTRIERYSFESLPNPGQQLVVYSGNNALLRDKNAMLPNNFLDKSLIVLVKAPDQVRRDRIRQRSPDIIPEELEIRIIDNGLDLVPHADLVIDTHMLNPEQTVDQVLSCLPNVQLSS